MTSRHRTTDPQLEAAYNQQQQQPPGSTAAELEGAWESAGAERDAILAGHGSEALEGAWVEAGTATTAPAAAAAAAAQGVAVAEEQEEEDEGSKAATRAASAAVLEALRESSAGRGPSAKLARSEFVGFISQLSRGELELEGNTVGISRGVVG